MAIDSLPFDWIMGVTDETIQSNIIRNPKYEPGNGQPQFFSGDVSFSFTEDDDAIKNDLILEGFILTDGLNLTVESFPSTGADTYTIKNAYDVKFCARRILTSVLQVFTESLIKIPFGPSDVINDYDARFLTNNLGGILACRIKNPINGDQWLRSFTISGQNVTLRDIKKNDDGIYPVLPIEGLQNNWQFDLISAYDIVLEGTKIDPSLFQGFVTKTQKNGEVSLKFSPYDKPVFNDREELIVCYIKMTDFNNEYPHLDSILQHDIFTSNQKIDFALLPDQQEALLNNFNGEVVSLKTYELKTRRPSILEKGTEVYIDVSEIPAGIRKVISVDEEYIHEVGELETIPFREVTYTFADREDTFAKLLGTFQQKNSVTKAKLAENRVNRIVATLFLSGTSDINYVIPEFIPAPTGLSFEWVDNNGFNLFWDEPIDEDIFHKVTVGLDENFITLINGYNDRNQGNGQLVNGLDVTANNTFYVKVRATKNGIFSEYTYLLNITKPVIDNTNFIFPSGKSPSLLYNRASFVGTSNSILDLANSNNASLSNSTSWVNSAKWGKGVDMSICNITIPSNDNFKPMGPNAKFGKAYAIEITSKPIGTLQKLYLTQNAEELKTEINIYYEFNSLGQVSFDCHLLDSTQTGDPSILAFKSNFVDCSLGDKGFYVLVDLANNSAQMLLNQSEITLYLRNDIGLFYSSVADYKASGGVNNYGTNVGMYTTSNFPPGNTSAILWRMTFAKDSNTPTIDEMKIIFENMGLI